MARIKESKGFIVGLDGYLLIQKTIAESRGGIFSASAIEYYTKAFQKHQVRNSKHEPCQNIIPESCSMTVESMTRLLEENGIKYETAPTQIIRF